MPAPTDTLIQTLAQQLPAAMQPYGVALLLLIGFTVFFALALILAVGAESHKRRRAEAWDKALSDGQRREKRPAHWGHYR